MYIYVCMAAQPFSFRWRCVRPGSGSRSVSFTSYPDPIGVSGWCSSSRQDTHMLRRSGFHVSFSLKGVKERVQ